MSVKFVLFFLFSIGPVLAGPPLSANRYLTYNILKDIFGPKSKSVLKKQIVQNPETFGGACSLMEEIYKEKSGKPVNLSGIHACFGGVHESKISTRMNDPQGRMAVMNQVCHHLLNNEETFNYLIQPAFLFTTQKDRIGWLVKRFYPYQSNTENYIDILNQVKGQSDMAFPKLRKIGLLLCLSEGWQKL